MYISPRSMHVSTIVFATHHKINRESMDEVLQPSEHVLRDADSVKGAGKDDLIQHLDDLLERYLNTLDEYDKVSKELSKQLSSVRSPGSLYSVA